MGRVWPFFLAGEVCLRLTTATSRRPTLKLVILFFSFVAWRSRERINNQLQEGGMKIISWISFAFFTLMWLDGKISLPGAVMLIAVGFAVPIVINRKNQKGTSQLENIRKEIAEIVGNSKFIHIENNTVIALNQAKKEVLLGKVGLMKKYPYADIREWTVVKETAGESVPVYGLGAANVIAAAASQAGSDARAAANTGLFIKVRDIDLPEWKIEMRNKDDRSRWFEILTQEINEGGVAA